MVAVGGTGPKERLLHDAKLPPEAVKVLPYAARLAPTAPVAEHALPSPYVLAFALGCPLAVLLVVAFQPWAPPSELLRDPMAIVIERSDCCGPHLGLVSHLGVAAWTASAAIAGFGALCLACADRGIVTRFLLLAAAISFVLAADDLLMLHELVLPGLGVPELLVYALYGSAGLLHGGMALRLARQSELVLLLVALAGLGASVTMDTLGELVGIHVPIGFEDGAKLIGASFWLAFHADFAARRIGRDHAAG